MNGQPQTPIAMMSHEDAKRSFLLQLQGFDEFRAEVTAADVSLMPHTEVDRLFTTWAVLTGNLEATVQRIEETRPE